MNIKYPRDSKILHVKNTKKSQIKDAENYKKTTEMQLNIDELQTKVNGLNQAVDVVSQSTQNFDDALNQISTNSLGIATLNQNLAALQSEVTVNTSNVAANTQSIINLQSAKQNNLIFDNAPTQNSNNVLSSGKLYDALQAKQDVLTAGNNITINNGVISASVPQIDTTNLATKTDLQSKQDILTAGNNITIDANNQISATNTTYTAGTGIDITNGVISATNGGGLSSVTAGDVDSELATQGQVLTADGQGGASWQNASGGVSQQDFEDLQDQVEQNFDNIEELSEILGIINGTIDPNKKNENFVTYNNNADIIKTFDYYDRELDIHGIGTNEFLLPNIIFTTNNVVTTNNNGTITSETAKAKIVIYIDYEALEVSNNTTFQIYDNNNLIDTISISYQSSDLHKNLQVVKIINDYECNSKMHNLYIVGNSVNEVTEIKIKHLLVEITAPNVIIQNKINPYDVVYCKYTDKYYLSDCRSGYAKICEIRKDELNNINDINWIDTGIEAQRYQFGFNYSKDNRNQIFVSSMFYMITKKNTNIEIHHNSNVHIMPQGTYKVSQFIMEKNEYPIYAVSAVKNVTTAYYYYIYLNFTTTYTRYFSDQTSIANLDACKINFDMVNGSFPGAVTIMKNGTTKFVFSYSSYNYVLQCPNLINCHIYPNQNGTASTNEYYIYGNYFGKIVKIVVDYYSYNIRNISYSFIGEYDEYFLGSNNDYFCIVNGKLKYFKNN